MDGHYCLLPSPFSLLPSPFSLPPSPSLFYSLSFFHVPRAARARARFLISRFLCWVGDDLGLVVISEGDLGRVSE